MAAFDPAQAIPVDSSGAPTTAWDPAKAVPVDASGKQIPAWDPEKAVPVALGRSSLAEVAAGVARGFYRGAQGAGAVLQAPAEMAGEQPGLVSRVGQSLEQFGKSGAEAYPAQTESHGPVTNFASQVAEAPGSALPLVAGALGGGIAGAPLGPAGAAVGSAVGGGGAAALQTYHEKYQEGLAKGLPDSDARTYAGNSAVASGVGMGILSAIPVVGPLSRAVAGGAGKAALAEAVGTKFLPELGKQAATIVGGNTAIGVGGAAAQAAIDQQAGLETPTPGEAAQQAILPSIAGAVGFLPLGAWHAFKAASSTAPARAQLQSSDPNIRQTAIDRIAARVNLVDPDAAAAWKDNAMNAMAQGKDIGTTPDYLQGPHPSLQMPTEQPPAAATEESPGTQAGTAGAEPAPVAPPYSVQQTPDGFGVVSPDGSMRAVVESAERAQRLADTFNAAVPANAPESPGSAPIEGQATRIPEEPVAPAGPLESAVNAAPEAVAAAQAKAAAEAPPTEADKAAEQAQVEQQKATQDQLDAATKVGDKAKADEEKGAVAAADTALNPPEVKGGSEPGPTADESAIHVAALDRVIEQTQQHAETLRATGDEAGAVALDRQVDQMEKGQAKLAENVPRETGRTDATGSMDAADEPPEIAAARTVLQAVDEGGIPLNPAKLRAVGEGLGLDISKSAKPEDTIARVRDAVSRFDAQPPEAARELPEEGTPTLGEAGRAPESVGETPRTSGDSAPARTETPPSTAPAAVTSDEGRTSVTDLSQSASSSPEETTTIPPSKLFGNAAHADAVTTKGFDALSADQQQVVTHNLARALADDDTRSAVLATVPRDVADALGKPEDIASALTVARRGPTPKAVADFVDAVAQRPGQADADKQAALSMRPEIGWAETGGRLIRAGADPDALARGDLSASTGDVVGRTKWVPKSDFWQGKPAPISEAGAHAALDALERGDKLSLPQKRFVDYATKYANDREGRDLLPDDFDSARDSLPPEVSDQALADAEHLDKSARSAGITDAGTIEDIAERAAMAAGDHGDYRQAIDNEIARRTGQAGAEGAERGAGQAVEERPGLALAGETNAEVLAREKGQAESAATAEAAGRVADNKAAADAQVGAFDLTGSDRKADTPGQADLLARQSPQEAKASAADKTLHTAITTGTDAKTVYGLLRKSGSPLYAELANRFESLGIAPKFETGKSAEPIDLGAKRYAKAAAYVPATDTVKLYTDKNATAHVLHELVHAATYDALTKRTLAGRMMENLYGAIKKSGVIGDEYGMKNVHEFVAEAHSNAKFQALLEGIKNPLPLSGIKSAWNAFVDIVRRVVGLPAIRRDALAQALKVGRDLMGENAGAKGAAGTEELPAIGAPVGATPATPNARKGYSLFQGVTRQDFPKQSAFAAVQKIFAPASRGDIALAQAGIMREALARKAHDSALANQAMTKAAAGFNKMTVDDQDAFTNAYERGGVAGVPLQLRPVAQAFKDFNDALSTRVQDLTPDKLQNLRENYLGRIWMDAADKVNVAFGKRPLEGNKGFLKQRVFEYYSEGLAHGLTPITHNPAEMLLLKGEEIRRFIAGQEIFQEMQSTGLAAKWKAGEQPAGWTALNDKIAQAGAERYYAPDEAATLMNNYLSPGLQGNGAYDMYRRAGSMLNSAQLGFSLFHVGFTMAETVIGKTALGLQQLSRGDFMKGLTSIASAPAQPFMNVYRGDKLLRAYLGKLNDPSLAPIVEALVKGGGRAQMEEFYKNATLNEFKNALSRNDKLGAAKAFLPTVIDKINAPVFQELVPRQKLGVFFDLAKDWLERNPNASVEEKRIAMGKYWDTVDNRMGMMTYDNLFWNKTLKDALMASVRSVGWNLGTFRELGGGALDLKNVWRDKELSSRTAYMIALPFTTAVMGSIIQYLYTGKGPDDLKDAFFPRTGLTRPDRTEDRVSLPTYMKDVYEYAHDIRGAVLYGGDPTQTIKNKMHPLLGVISQMISNKDFYGGAIRSPGDSAVRQLQDEAEYLVTQLTPFSARNYMQQAQARHEDPSFAGFLTNPSMIGVTPSPGYITKNDQQAEASALGAQKDALKTKFREALQNGEPPGEVAKRMLAAGLRLPEVHEILREGLSPVRTSKLPPRRLLPQLGG